MYQSCTDGPETQQSLLCQAGYESNTPEGETFTQGPLDDTNHTKIHQLLYICVCVNMYWYIL